MSASATSFLWSDQFAIGNHDFGEQKIFFLDFPKEMPEDGLLGMDFIGQHIIYLDFKKQIAYIR